MPNFRGTIWVVAALIVGCSHPVPEVAPPDRLGFVATTAQPTRETAKNPAWDSRPAPQPQAGPAVTGSELRQELTASTSANAYQRNQALGLLTSTSELANPQALAAPSSTTSTSESVPSPSPSSTDSSTTTMATSVTTAATTPPPTTATTVPAPSTTSAPVGEQQIVSADFNATTNAGFGSVSAAGLASMFGTQVGWLGGAGSLEVRDGALRVSYAPESDGSTSVAFPVSFRSASDVTMSYRLLLEPGWEFVKGGKLPGLAGGSAPTGGAGGNGSDGFSARLMWRTNGSLVVYAYHPDRPSQWGEDFVTTATLPVGEWVTLTERVTMNTPGQSDGAVQVWVNGNMVLNQGGIRWRTDESFGIDLLLFSTFYGGGDSSWSPSGARFAQFDDFTIKVHS